MTVELLAAAVIDACESEGVQHMLTGAFAFNLYGIARATKDVDVVLSVAGSGPIERVIARLDPIVEFNAQVQFDTRKIWDRKLSAVDTSVPSFMGPWEFAPRPVGGGGCD